MNQKSVSGLGLALMLMAAIGLGGSTANAVSGSQPAPSLNPEDRSGAVEPEPIPSYRTPILINPAEMVADIHSSEMRQLRGHMIQDAFRALDLPTPETAPRWGVDAPVASKELEHQKVGVQASSKKRS
jgi:hypothetical protein